MSTLGKILDGGVISPKAAAPAAFHELFRDVLALCRRMAPDTIIVEQPAASARAGGRTFTRSVLTLPTYGGGVASVYLAAVCAKPPEGLLTPAADEWPRNFAAPTKGDDHKQARVAQVRSWWQLGPDSLGVKSKAGNVADAVLMAQWAINRGAVGRVLAFDPSVSHTGYCLMEAPDGPGPK